MDRYHTNRQGMGRQGYPYRANQAAMPSAMPVADAFPACGCIAEDAPVDGMPIAMGYVPMQKYKTTFEPCRALAVGTVFPELCKQFVGKRGKSC